MITKESDHTNRCQVRCKQLQLLKLKFDHEYGNQLHAVNIIKNIREQ